MRQRIVILILLLGLPIALYLVFKSNGYAWYYSESLASNQPYGLSLYMSLIEDRTDTLIETKSGPHRNWGLDSIGDQRGVIFQNSGSFRDSIEYFKLDSLARLGHHIIFSQEHLDKKLLYFLQEKPYPDPDSLWMQQFNINLKDSVERFRWNYANIGEIKRTYIYEPRIQATFIPTGAQSDFRYARENDTLNFDQHFFFGTSLSKRSLDVELSLWEPLAHLSDDEDEIIALRVPRGEGYIYLITTYAPFTNYCLANSRNFQYASDFTSLLPSDFFWLSNYYYIPPGGQEETERESNSPLQFIVSNPPLRWAWYLLLISLFLFLIFRTQRRQRVIPVITARKNQSLEFAKSLGILQSKAIDNHANAALEIKRQFRFWTRSRFPRITEVDDAYRDMLIQMLPEKKDNIKQLFFLFERAQKNPEAFSSENLNSVYTITRYIYDHV